MAFFLSRKFQRKGENNHSQICEHRDISQTSQQPYQQSSPEGIEVSDSACRSHPEPEPEVAHEQGSLTRDSTCTICADEKKAQTRYRRKLIAGLLLPWTLQALDLTIISSALPFIASDFNELSQLNWIVSAFKLCSAAFIPAWGQCSDVFGRYVTLQMAIMVMLIGSTLCSAAPATAFPMFLVGRALQGMGCSGITILTKIILADKVSLAENARNNTMFTMVGGAGYGIGPVVGGYLTRVSWRWCFIINIPIGVVGVILAHFILRRELLGPQEITRTDGSSEPEVPSSTLARLSTFDFGGQLLFLFGTVLLILALTWAGAYYPWSDGKIIAPLVIGLILLGAFIGWEYLMIPGHALAIRYPYQRPMIPLKLLCRRNVGILFYTNFSAGMSMFAVFYFVDLYFALVLDYPSSKAGINLLYYIPGLAAGVYIAMFTTNVYPRTTLPPLFLGNLLEPLGTVILAIALHSDRLHLIFGMLVLTGVGTGVRMMPGTLHAIGYHPSDIAPIVSLMLLASSLGGTMATTVMLNILNSRLGSRGIGGGGKSLDAIAGMSGEMQDLARTKAREGIVVAFLAISSFLWLNLLLGLGLGNVTIGKAGKPSSVVKGSYIGSLLRREKGADEKT